MNPNDLIVSQSAQRRNPETAAARHLDDSIHAACLAVWHREQVLAQRRQAVYMREVSEEAAVWWSWVREQYEDRRQELMCIAGGAAARGDEERFDQFSARVARWQRALRRLDGMDPRAMFLTYQRVRMQPTVRSLVDALRNGVQ